MSGNLNDVHDSIYRLSRSLQIGLMLIFLQMLPIEFARFGEFGIFIGLAFDLLMLGVWFWAMVLLHQVGIRSREYNQTGIRAAGNESK